MPMLRFDHDYAEGAHPRILQRIIETNDEQHPGYGTDQYCDRARLLIQQACNAPGADVHLLVGGTQTNKIVIASILRPHQGVLSPESGHIAVHETGAIEATGHKVLTLPSKDGKITASQVQQYIDGHNQDASNVHTVQPGMVYLSQPTENGTSYSKAELEALSTVCRNAGLPLFIDGARLGYALAADGNDLTLEEIAKLADVFYIGGTKVGALFGEAVVITNPQFKSGFRYLIKQNGGLLAKGRLLGIQFETLFEDGLYFDISKQAVEFAWQIRHAFEAKGFAMKFDSITNQQFPILPNTVLAKLSQKYSFTFWEKVDENHSVVRFCTSWATKAENVAELLEDINQL